MPNSEPTQYPHLKAHLYASVVIEHIKVPCALSERLYVYIPLSGICDVIGIDPRLEEARIQKDPALNEGMVYMPFSVERVGEAVHEEDIPCISLTRLHTWLWGIDVDGVPEAGMQKKLLLLKRELADLAYAYFGRPMLSADLKAEERQQLSQEQQDRFDTLEQQYLLDHPTINEANPTEEPEAALRVVVSSEPPEVEFIDDEQGKVYRAILGILGRLAEQKKVPGDPRKGYQRVEAALKEEFDFTYYWVIRPDMWEPIIRHCIQVYQGYAGKGKPIPPVLSDALKMKAKPRKLNSDGQPRLF